MVERTRALKIKRVTLNTLILAVTATISGMVSLTYGISVFGYVMLCAFLSNNFSGFVCFFSVLGYLLSGNFKNAVFYTISCISITFLSRFKDKLSNKWKIVCCGVLLLTEILRCYTGGFLYYYFFIIALEIIITYFLTDYYGIFVNYLCTKKMRKTLSKKELASVVIVLFVSLSVLSDYTFAYGIKPIGIVSVYIIFCVAVLYDCSVSAAAGTLLGFLTSISNSNLLYTMGSYALSGFFAGIGKTNKK